MGRARLLQIGRLRRHLKSMIGLALAAALLGGASPANAAPTIKKAIWGPVTVDGKNQFPIYRKLGAGIYHQHLRWDRVAPTRPRRQRDPADPAYNWPAEIDHAIRAGASRGITVSLMVMGAPAWANGGKAWQWAPRRAKRFAKFLTAASRRYKKVRHWMVWGEPSRRENFRPLPRNKPKGPRIYARLLDAGYRALKRRSRRNLVIGGNTFTTGHVSPKRFIRYLRLPGGKRPRMDMWGHNPFTRRTPDLSRPPLGYGFADFSDLDTLAGWIDRYYGRHRGRKLRLYLAEFTAPTDHENNEFNFWVSRKTQARWVKAALRITRRWNRIYTMGWYTLYDEPPQADGLQANHGLLDWRGRKKPAFGAFRRG